MKRFLPKTLTAQTIWVLLIGLTVSHFLSMLIYSSDRVESLSLMGGRNMASRIASVSHLIIESPSDWHERIVMALNEPTFRVTITPESMLPNKSADQSERFKEFLRSQIGLAPDAPLIVQLFEMPHEGGILNTLSLNNWMHMQMMNRMHGVSSHESMRVSFQLPSGKWLNFTSDIPETTTFWSFESLMSLALMALGVIILSIWVVRRITVPLRAFADAAKKLGRDVKAPPMSEKGPLEVQEAAHAFNDMQDRLHRLLDNRTQMLGAISHDLRTPITLLRLRAELVEDEGERDKMLATLDDMAQMISLTLDFAREESSEEERRKVDITALVESVCEDMVDAAKLVEMKPAEQILYLCAATGMKRVLNNLIENAVKYADAAVVSITQSSSAIHIIVEDNGPGIAVEHMGKVTQPFYRCETSRNRDTGGVGLGLSLAQSIIRNHGGEMKLENKVTGGLKITVSLPF